MFRQSLRAVMFWFVFALQAVTPFIHAHAGTAQIDHAGFMHLHQPVSAGADRPAFAGVADGAGVEVAQGLRLRTDTRDTENVATVVLPVLLSGPGCATQPVAGLPAPPLPQWIPPDHAHPPVLAPPSV